MVTKKLKIVGVVQGVGFRYHMMSTARELDVTGWVKNLPDGNVEAMIQGNSSQIVSIMSWAKKGPPGAHVDRVVTEDLLDAETFLDFKIAY